MLVLGERDQEQRDHAGQVDQRRAGRRGRAAPGAPNGAYQPARATSAKQPARRAGAGSPDEHDGDAGRHRDDEGQVPQDDPRPASDGADAARPGRGRARGRVRAVAISAYPSRLVPPAERPHATSRPTTSQSPSTSAIRPCSQEPAGSWAW